MDLDYLNKLKDQADKLRQQAKILRDDAEAFRTDRDGGRREPFLRVLRETDYNSSKETYWSERRRKVLEPILAQYAPHIMRLAELELTGQAQRLHLEADAIEATIAASILPATAAPVSPAE
jgi:hypothetical protein